MKPDWFKYSIKDNVEPFSDTFIVLQHTNTSKIGDMIPEVTIKIVKICNTLKEAEEYVRQNKGLTLTIQGKNSLENKK